MAIKNQENPQQLKPEKGLLKNWKEGNKNFQNFIYKKPTKPNLLIVITFNQEWQPINENVHRQFNMNVIIKDSWKHIEIINVIQ